MRPFVVKPNFVPRSYTRLNSTYRPRRSCCHAFCSGVNAIVISLQNGEVGLKKTSTIFYEKKHAACSGPANRRKHAPNARRSPHA